ncbi:MAG TPA: hypothetical protein DCO83_16575 [Mucilaginibacter sp.]|nr:hypothetical protein [Mucilaginibacter sp.]
MKTRKYLLCIAAVLSFFTAFSQQGPLAARIQNTGSGTSARLIVDSRLPQAIWLPQASSLVASMLIAEMPADG